MSLVLITELRAGDVLLCYKDCKVDPVGNQISSVTASDYTHAAICVDSASAVEAQVVGGVKKTAISDLVKRYGHVAVFRNPDAWCFDEQVKALNVFVDRVIASDAKYNFRRVVNFRKRQDIHQLTLSEKLKAFFDGKLEPSPAEKGKYFCSELVADCFVASGLIDPSAAVYYQSDVISPGALGRDATFGTFYGYVSADSKYKVPPTDEFFDTTTYRQIFS